MIVYLGLCHPPLIIKRPLILRAVACAVLLEFVINYNHGIYLVMSLRLNISVSPYIVLISKIVIINPISILIHAKMTDPVY